MRISDFYTKREPWLDSIKFFAIILVVLGHVMGFLTDNGFIGYDYIQGFIKFFNMPLFFILSGSFPFGVIITKASLF